jgi:4-amino-4-deoxy-L-arabinose transferase-like glycosyltransferase
MKNFLRKYKFILLIFAFVTIRLFNLSIIPIFNDEAAYLSWGRVFIRHISDLGPIPLAIDGKQTGVPFLYGLIQLLPFDPLITGRLISIIFSLVTFVVTIGTAKKLGMEKSKILLALFLMFCPYLFFFDRLALPEAMVTACYTLSFYLLLSILENPTIKKGIFLGAILAFGWYFKSTILLALPVIFCILLIEIIKNREKWKILLVISLEIIGTLLLLVAPLLFNLHYINGPHHDTDRLLTLADGIPWVMWIANARKIFSWFIVLCTPFTLIGLFTSLVHIKSDKKLIYIFLWLIFPVVFEIFFVKSVMSRWPVLAVPVFLIIVAYGLSKIGKFGTLVSYFMIIIFISGVSLLLFSPLTFFKAISVNTETRDDMVQYFSGWTSGYGVNEAVTYLSDRAKLQPVTVFVRLDGGNPEDAMHVYLPRFPNITVLALDNMWTLDRYQKEHPEFFNGEVYFVSRGNALAGLDNKLTEIKKFNKPLDPEFVGVYNLKM